jgi:hypothetical protein
MKRLVGILLLLGVALTQSGSVTQYHAVVARKKAAGGGGTSPGTTNLYGAWSFDDASSPMQDSHTTNNDITGQGSPSYSQTALTNGTSVYFDTGDSGYNLDDAGQEAGSNDFVVALALKLGSTAGDEYIVSKWWPTGGNRSWLVRYNNTNSSFEFLLDGDGASGGEFSVETSTTTPDTTSTFLLIASFDNSANTLDLWVSDDGAAWEKNTTSSVTANPYDGSAGLHFFGRNSGTHVGDGTADDAFYWVGADVAFTDDNATWMLNGGSWRTYSDL